MAGMTAGMAAGKSKQSTIASIANAYSAYEAGKMQQLAYEHEAAVAELNANQIRIDGMFTIADQTTELANNLALQNVIAAASGRVGGQGSLRNLAETSNKNFESNVNRIKATGKSKQVSALMSSQSSRIAGESAANRGLLKATSTLVTGLSEASKFIKPKASEFIK